MNYTLHQLQVLKKIAETESITKASEELYLTQPAVSIQLKKLQDQFTIPLTEVIGRKLFITDFGREVVESVERILEEVEAINYMTNRYRNLLAGKLRIAVASTGKYVMPYFLTDFVNQHTAVDLNMDVTNKSLVVEAMERNEVDFSLVSTLPSQLDVSYIDLFPNKLHLIGAKRLKTKRNLSVKGLFKNYPLLFREAGSATRVATEKFISRNKLEIHKKLELASNEATKQAVLAGLGYSVMSLVGIKNELQNKELEIIPIRGLPIVTHWRLVWLKSKRQSPLAEAYLDYIRQEKDRIIKEYFQWYVQY